MAKKNPFAGTPKGSGKTKVSKMGAIRRGGGHAPKMGKNGSC